MNNCENQQYLMDFENMRRIRDLGQGSNGVVALYENPSDQSQIAIKTLYQNGSDNSGIIQQFNREIQALIKLKHPFVLPIIGFTPPKPRTETDLETPPKIATKYAANGSLKDVLEKIARGQPPDFVNDTWIASVIGSIVLGMEYIHSNNYIHRDLKPGNILIDEQGNVMIGDLGSSRFADLHITYTKMVGSPFYMAPEMYNEGQYTNAVDVYSFSLILYELLVGRPVFPRNIQPLPLMRRVCEGNRPEIPENIHPVIRDIIQNCWDVEPHRRYSFYDIYEKLLDINFQIRPNVDSSRLKSLFGGDSSFRFHVKLLNGETHTMQICPNDTHTNFRAQISNYADLDYDSVIPSINGGPLSCCWGCNLGPNPIKFQELIPNWKRRNKVHNDFIIDLLFQFKANYHDVENGNKIRTTKFFMKPGSIFNLYKEITSPYRRLWFLRNCHIRVFYYDEELIPSDESMIEKGIITNSIFEVYREFNMTVTVNNKSFRCHSDDPVEELIMRYANGLHVKPRQFIYLKKNETIIDRYMTFAEAGIVDNDVLNVYNVESSREVKVVFDHCQNFLQIPPNTRIIDLKWNALLATGYQGPIETIRVFNDAFDYDFIEYYPNLRDSTTIYFTKKLQYSAREYLQY